MSPTHIDFTIGEEAGRFKIFVLRCAVWLLRRALMWSGGEMVAAVSRESAIKAAVYYGLIASLDDPTEAPGIGPS